LEIIGFVQKTLGNTDTTVAVIDMTLLDTQTGDSNLGGE
jgi:hypothetical protein